MDEFRKRFEELDKKTKELYNEELKRKAEYPPRDDIARPIERITITKESLDRIHLGYVEELAKTYYMLINEIDLNTQLQEQVSDIEKAREKIKKIFDLTEFPDGDLED